MANNAYERGLQRSNRMKLAKKTFLIIMAILILLVGAFYIYTLDYYRADEETLHAMSSSDSSIERFGRITVFNPKEETDSNTGFIFYPGGKVEAIAYAPLLKQLANQGITCVLVKMPFNLAVFDINACDKALSRVSNVSRWYLAGHSLGGAMASSYVDNNSDHLEGLILLGAYPINNEDIPTLVVYGSEDLGLDISKLSHTKNVFKIFGGNHAYFGNYGEQKGDGTASISRQTQQEIATTKIMAFINQK